MMVVGSTLSHFDKVTGLFYARRSNRFDRISIWLSSNDREVCRQSEAEWIELLNKVNMEGFNFGTTTFTNHKGSAGHHVGRENRGERDGRDNRGDRDQYRGGDRYDNRDNRDNRDSRDGRDNRDNRDNRDSRDNRDGRDNRDNRDSRDSRDGRDSRGGDRRPTGPNKFASRGGSSSGAFGGTRQPSERTSDWNRQ